MSINEEIDLTAINIEATVTSGANVESSISSGMDVTNVGVGGPKGDKGDKGDTGPQGPQGEQGDKGDKGDKGDTGTAATIAAGTTTTLPAGSSATVTNSGTSSAAVLNFGIPKGDKGDKGETGSTGPAGPANTLSIGTVTGGATADATITGTSPNQTLNLTLPKGDTGTPGQAATIAVGTVSTGTPGSSATVTNSGTSSAAVFDFSIPQGMPGSYTAGNAIDITSDTINAHIYPDDFFTDDGKTSGTGTSFALADTIELPTLKDVQLKGDATQQTYSGKNLCNAAGLTIATGGTGITITANEDGSITINGTSTDRYNNYRVIATDIISGIVGQTATVSVQTSGTGSWNNFGIKTETGSNLLVANNTSNPATGVIPQSSTGKYAFDLYFANNITFNNFNMKLQVEVGSTATTFEKFVGGVASPNPDYPQTVNVVTGEQSVLVRGKNLFNSFAATKASWQSGTLTIKNDGSLELSGNTGSNGYFALTQKLSALCPSLSIGDTVYLYLETTSSAGAKIYIGENWLSGNSKTITQTMLDASVVVYGGYNQTDTIKIMVTKTVDTSYESYQGQSYTIDLGSTELCRIDTYQDKIYKSGGNWYLHKETGFMNLKNTTGWWISGGGQGTNNVYQMANYVGSGVVLTEKEGFSDKFDVVTSWSSVRIPNELLFVGNNVYIRVIGSIATTAAQLETYLASNDVFVYYILATPTDTQITDANLIAQLEALAGADCYAGQTNFAVTAAGLPGVLAVEADSNSLAGLIDFCRRSKHKIQYTSWGAYHDL